MKQEDGVLLLSLGLVLFFKSKVAVPTTSDREELDTDPSLP